ncbi:MAG: ribosome maturation factor RimP, partial [Clostridia bacterium]|nr:ribosome maturation factor RimP [Clostridia bacterium]
MDKSGKNIASRVRPLAERIAEPLGLEIWDVEFVKEGAEMVLRITIDKPEGVTIDDCEAMHRAIDPVLDEEDPIEGSYRLEVSSPGLERVLNTTEHLRKCLGETVEVRLFAPLGGKKILLGALKDADDQTVVLESEGETVSVPRNAAAKIQTYF